jgi:GntR family transcriptional regulator
VTTARRGGRPGGRVALYRKVEQDILQRIRSGELAPGDRLPTEPELAAEWQVNRLTIRQAIGELARAGHVTVRQGAGTFVAAEPLIFEFTLPPVRSTDADLRSGTFERAEGQEDQTETLVEVTERDTDPLARDALRTEGPLVRVDTVVENAGQPLLVSSYWIDSGRTPGLARRIAEPVVLFEILRDRYDIELRHSWRSLSAGSATSADAILLDVAAGSPVMLREGVNIDRHGTPTVYLRRRLRGDRVRFTLRYETL